MSVKIDKLPNSFTFIQDMLISGIRYPKIIEKDNKMYLFGSMKVKEEKKICKYLPHSFELDDDFNIIDDSKSVLNLNNIIDNIDDLNISAWTRNVWIDNNIFNIFMEFKVNINNTIFEHYNYHLSSNNLLKFNIVADFNKIYKNVILNNKFLFFIIDDTFLCSEIIKTDEFWGKYLFKFYNNELKFYRPKFDCIVDYTNDHGHVIHNILHNDKNYEMIFTIRHKINNYKNYSNNMDYIYKIYKSKSYDLINFFDTKEIIMINDKVITEFYSYPCYFEKNNEQYLICNQDDFGKLKSLLLFKYN